MIVSDFINNTLQNQGYTKTWLADKLNITKQLLNDKFKRNAFTGQELVDIGCILGIDLNRLKH